MTVVVKQSYFKGGHYLIAVLIESYFLSTWFAFR
jgi:hypothetical protein